MKFVQALESPELAVSWIEVTDLEPARVYWAASPRRIPPGCPETSVTRLVSGIYALEPRMARKWMRNRIFTTQDRLTPLCRGIVKVAAKRMTRLDPREGERLALKMSALCVKVPEPASPDGIEFLEDVLFLRSSDEIIMALRELRQFHRDALLTPEASARPRHERDRQVSALLISRDGRVLARSRNTNASVRTRHAEMNLVQGWWDRHRQPLPEGAAIWVTLKPCRMCAGAIWQAAPALNPDPAGLPTLRVFYLEDDPGPGARLTVLEAGSPERLAAIGEAGLPREYANREVQIFIPVMSA